MNAASTDAIIRFSGSRPERVSRYTKYMDLAGKYEKSNLLGDGEVKVWRGRDKATRTPVLLHQLPADPKLLRLAVEYLLAKPPGSPLLEMGEIGEATYLVTISELDLLDVTAWLENALLTAKTAPAAPAPTAPAPAPAPQRVDTTGPISIPRVDSGPVAKPAPVQQPGEFTRAFQLPSSSPPSPTGPVPVPRVDTGPVSKPPAVQQPGEFTRAFQLPNPAAPPPPAQYPVAGSAPNNASAKPGEFTQLFHVPGPGEHRPSPPAPELGLPPSLPETNSPSTRSAGEFTRLFRPPAAAPNSPWAQPNDTLLRDLPPRQTFPPPELPAEPAPPKFSLPSGPVPLPDRGAPPVPKGPGEYTRIIQTQPLQTAPAQASAPAAPSPSLAQAVHIPTPVVTPPSLPSIPSVQAPQVPHVQASIPVPSAPQVSMSAPTVKRTGISPVIFLFGGLVLVALVLILIFALRR